MQGWGAIIQAIGAIGAIVVIIYGFSQLNKDSEDKQKQIDSLATLAKESALQTNHLSSQVDEMIEGNILLRKNVNLIQETVSIGEKTLKISQNKYDQEKRQRKLNIMPQFKLDGNPTRFYTNPSNTPNYLTKFRLIFENIGEKATIKEIVKLENNKIEIDFSDYIDREYLKGKGFNIEPIHESAESVSGILIHYKIIYADIEKNKYYQIFECQYGEKYKISKPKEVLTV